MERFAGAPADTGNSAPGPRDFRCVAHGCPAMAGIDHGSGETICRFHYGEPVNRWQAITERLRRRQWLVRLADTCATQWISDVPGWGRHAEAAAAKHGRPELEPNAEREIRPGVIRSELERPILYAQRLNAVLMHECLAGRETPHDEPRPAPPAEGPRSVGDLAHDFVL
jgi:hypothetical protein